MFILGAFGGSWLRVGHGSKKKKKLIPPKSWLEYMYAYLSDVGKGRTGFLLDAKKMMMTLPHMFKVLSAFLLEAKK